MRICLISVEIFAWGKYGGFGRATRWIGGALADRGHQVLAVVPRRRGQRAVEDLDGIQVHGFNPASPWRASRLFRQCDADIYHSCEPSFGTWLALRAAPHRKHMVTFRDPRDLEDWRMEFSRPSLNKPQVLANYIYESNFLVRRCIRRMDAVYTNARYLIPKVRAMYHLEPTPRFLPTPVRVPERVRKASTPTLCFVSRLDRRKRPELCLDLAKKFPHTRFLIVGKSRDPRWERRLRARYEALPNVRFLGFLDQFSGDEHSKVLEASWILMNSATREAMPNAFLEAAAHRCAILSGVDPDGFASRFGYHAKTDDFATGLAWLLEGDRWRERGERAHAHVREHFEFSRAIDLHIQAYREVLRV